MDIIRKIIPFCSALLFLCISAATVFAENGADALSGSYMTPLSLLPPVVAIVLALLTKEVYSSLFAGIVIGALLYSGFNIEKTLTHIFSDGIVAYLSFSLYSGYLS